MVLLLQSNLAAGLDIKMTLQDKHTICTLFVKKIKINDPISCCAPGLLLLDSNVSLEEEMWLTECIYLADYFKLRKKKEKTE
jgi:CO/xanthine dehydrogenase FAD-binding subunit